MVTTTYSYESETTVSRGFRARSEVEMMTEALDVNKRRFRREFLTPEPTKFTANYYPRWKQTGMSNTGSPFVSYYARPYFNYNVPSKYGFSKFITVEKCNGSVHQCFEIIMIQSRGKSRYLT